MRVRCRLVPKLGDDVDFATAWVAQAIRGCRAEPQEFPADCGAIRVRNLGTVSRLVEELPRRDAALETVDAGSSVRLCKFGNLCRRGGLVGSTLEAAWVSEMRDRREVARISP